MTKTILLTGATDGIGLETAKMLAEAGHTLLLHGRSPDKLAAVADSLGVPELQTFRADLTSMAQVTALADAVLARGGELDALINNAGVLKLANPVTEAGLDARFVVNTLAPALLTEKLLPMLGTAGRVINLSSAAQATVDTAALAGGVPLSDMEAYSQSKLAITMWSQEMAARHPQGPVFVAVNPGSLLASKMVKEGFGIAGNDLSIGAQILCRAALSDEFATASGRYFDNDSGRFAPPHRDAQDGAKVAAVMSAIEATLARLTG